MTRLKFNFSHRIPLVQSLLGRVRHRGGGTRQGRKRGSGLWTGQAIVFVVCRAHGQGSRDTLQRDGSRDICVQRRGGEPVTTFMSRCIWFEGFMPEMRNKPPTDLSVLALFFLPVSC